jgi:hypothetical protein
VKNLASFVLKHRINIIVGTILLTVFFAVQLTNLKVNSDILSYLPKDDPAVVLFNKVGDEFGGNSLALVAVENNNTFSRDALRHVHQLTERFKTLDGVSSLTSLTDVLDIKKIPETEGGGIEVGKLMDPNTLPSTEEQLKDLKAYTLSKDLYNARLVSSDGTVSLIICRIRESADKVQVARELKEIVQSANLPEKFYFGGIPFQLLDVSSIISKDLKLLVPLVSLLLFITLFVSFGHLRGAIIPLLSVAISTTWTLGLMSLFNVPLTVISDLIPVILIAVGSASSIHIISKYDENAARYGNTGEEATEAFSEVGIRVILAAATIVFGFTSFIFGSYLTMIREFGIYTALGVFFSLVVSTMLVPSVLSLISVRDKRKDLQPYNGKKTLVVRLMDRLGGFVLKNEKLIVLSSIVLIMLGGLGLPKIERKVNMVDYFKPETNVRMTEEIMQKKLGGSLPVQIFVDGDVQNPFVLKEMRLCEKYLQSINDVHNPQSIADLIAEMNGVMTNDKIVPDSKDKVTNLWFLLEGQDILPQLVNDEKTEGLIQATVSTVDTKTMRGIVEAVDNYIAQMDTSLVVVDLNRLPERAKAGVYKYRVRRIASAIEWDAQRRNHQLVVSKDSIEKHLLGQAVSPESGSDPAGGTDVSSIVEVVTRDFPESLRNDNNFVNDVRNDIAELHQTFVAIPQRDYENLALPEKTSPERVSFHFSATGMPLIYQHLDDSLLSSQIQSFILSLILIFILLAVQLRSLVGGIIGLAPIVLTIFVTFGIMGFANIPLDVATVLVASIALGIGIDYSIHFTIRFKTYFRGSTTALEALDSTLETTGRAIITNMLAVTMGFLTLLFAELVPLQRFGILVAITMIGSGLGSLTFLPALILLSRTRSFGDFSRFVDKVRNGITRNSK